jgi:hypothetical protein
VTALRLHRLPLLLAAATLATFWFAGHGANPGPIGFRLDDAWIHMVYGRGLLANGFLAYEDGVPSTGCTSPAWAIVLAGVHAIAGRGAATGTIVAVVILAGALIHLAGVALATLLARRASFDATTAIAAGALVAIAPPIAGASLSGMEVTLTGSLLLGGLAASAAGRMMTAGVALALAGLSRPESAAAVVVAAVAVARSRGRWPRLGRLLFAPVIAAGAFVSYNLWASGDPLPATFYLKSAPSLTELPGRVATAVTRLFAQVPPFGTGLGWLALLGLALPSRGKGPGPQGAVPFAAAAAYALANLFVMDPVDPDAFYHQRYLWPAAPLLLVAAAIGASRLSVRFPRLGRWPLGVLCAAALAQTATTIGPASRHFHNDIRNINEVQRRIGETLREALPPGTRVASSDAGAVRYFSQLPTLDVVGLNTPGMRAPTGEYLRSHPVAALALLPAWFRTPDGARLEEIFRAETSGYTVTSNPAMALQVVLRARPGAGPGPVRARFVGFRAFALDFVPPEVTSSRGVP